MNDQDGKAIHHTRNTSHPAATAHPRTDTVSPHNDTAYLPAARALPPADKANHPAGRRTEAIQQVEETQPLQIDRTTNPETSQKDATAPNHQLEAETKAPIATEDLRTGTNTKEGKKALKHREKQKKNAPANIEEADLCHHHTETNMNTADTTRNHLSEGTEQGAAHQKQKKEQDVKKREKTPTEMTQNSDQPWRRSWPDGNRKK